MIGLYVLFAVVYTVYHFTFFSYSSYIFNYTERRKFWGSISCLINITYWIGYHMMFGIEAEPLLAITFPILLVIEYMCIFKLNLFTSMYISFTFALNLFAKRLILLASIPLFIGGSVFEVMSDPRYYLSVIGISSLLSVNTITLARKSLSKIYLDTILSDKKNIQFLTGVFAIIYTTIVAMSFAIIDPVTSGNLLYYYAIVGLFFLLAFVLFIVYAYDLANLRITAANVKMAEEANKQDLEIVDELQKQASTDALTGMLTRDEFEERLKFLLKKNKKIFVVFIDIDGLKYANDEFGHREGDFYITKVSHIAQKYFPNAHIGRYGGDEVLVVEEYTNEMHVNSKVVKCYNEVGQISTKYEKNYPTSISYGIVFVKPGDQMKLDEIIKLGDSRMYEMKKLRQKHRKVEKIK